MREPWTDERLDDLKGSVDGGFKRMDDRFSRLETNVDERFAKVDDRFERLDARLATEFGRVNDRLDGLERLIAQFAVTFTGAMLVGFAAVFTAILTRL